MSKVLNGRNSQKKNEGVENKRNVQNEIEGKMLKCGMAWSNSRNNGQEKESRIVINVEDSRNRMKSKSSKTKIK